MKQTKTFSILFSLFISVFIISCSDSDDPEPAPKPSAIKMTVDKPTIKADGTDLATFTVTADGNEVETQVIVFLKEDSIALTGTDFSTEKAGVYTFYAVYDEQRSNEISIEATEIGVLLAVDKATLKTNNRDAATFSVTYDDKDVTSSAVITLIGTPDSTLKESTFSTSQTGSYKFYATYDGKKSNEISIDASDIILTLSVDKKTLNVDHTEKATFMVLADGEDVTNESEIILIKDMEQALETNIFKTSQADSYTFYATYDGFTSDVVTVEAYYEKMNFLQRFCIIQAASTACKNCVIMRNVVSQVTGKDPERYETINLHLRGKYCTSGLSGDPALYKTAERFADMGIAQYTPPLSVVELHYPVQLWSPNSFTIEDINNAIASTKSARGGSSNSGIAINSAINNQNIEFKVNTRSNKTNQYRFFAFVVEDKIIHPQVTGNNESDSKYEHNSIGTYMLENADPFQGVEFGEVKKGQELSRTFTINMNHFDTKRTVNTNNCRIVAYTLRMINGKYRIDNIVSCPVNGSVGYEYETE